MKCGFLTLLALAPFLGDAARLRAPNASGHLSKSSEKAASVNSTRTAGEDIDKVRAFLMKVTNGLKPMLQPDSKLSATAEGAALRDFYVQARSALNETAGKKDHGSFVRLQNISSHVHGLFQELTARQEDLKIEGEGQQNNLLLGVLMTKQHDPMERQLEVLKAPDFAALPVTKAVLAKADTKTPLFRQVAAYLDAHPHDAVSEPSTSASGKKSALSAIVTNLQTRLDNLKSRTARSRALHDAEDKHLKAEEAKVRKTSKARANAVKSLRKSEDRKFVKMMAMSSKDEQSMKEAIAAIKKGDVKGLERAEAALQASVVAMQSRNGGFLVLVQESLREAGMDCPYCVAQCVDKCHNEGKPYVGCLTECADAGK